MEFIGRREREIQGQTSNQRTRQQTDMREGICTWIRRATHI